MNNCPSLAWRFLSRLLLSRLLLSVVFCGGTARLAWAEQIVVYGGTSAGVAAAVQASRLGRSVVLLEPSRYLGGLTTSGLGFTDTGDKTRIGGVARDFYRRIKQHYDQPTSWRFEKSADYARYRADEDAMFTFEPHVATLAFDAMLRDAQVRVVREQQLDRRQGVRLAGNRIQSIAMETGEVYAGEVFIDATYEGDLMAAAGVTYTVGREANAQYGETINGIQPRLNLYNHRFLHPVSPFQKPGDPASGLIAGVRAEGPGVEGGGDAKIQAYCFRMCMTRVAANRVPFPRPEGYDEREYELLFRIMESGDLRMPFSPDLMPNGKTDTNNLGSMSTDYINANWDYPEASHERRAEIVAAHVRYQQGLMWTLQNHPRVPEAIRGPMAEWGLARDEFLDNGHWPHQLYIREARRMVADHVMTEKDCRRQTVVGDSVGMGSYNMDSHNTQRYVDAAGHAANEGDVQVSPGGPYRISYRSIVPRKGETANLLVPVCLSASHIAYGSIRMEPVFMILGHSAATAASLALEQQRGVQEIDVDELRRRLVAEGQVLE